ncbi:MAG: transposase zinc-binding domain-containing protein [Syntrophales bacterium]
MYDEYFSRQHGFWRPYVEQVIYRYLDCGNFHNGFARVKCKDCGHEPQGNEKAFRKSWARLISKDIRDRYPCLPEMSEDDADHQFH